MVGLREQNKALRREAILDATLELLRETHPAELTTGQIAERADVSAATVFNLIGTRDVLLARLVERVLLRLIASLADLERGANSDPIAAARLIVDESVAAFTTDSTAYRRILSEIGPRRTPDGVVRHDPAELQEAAMREAQERGIIDPAFDAAGLGRQIYLSYSAAMLSWANRNLDDHQFLVAARHGLLTVLAATATEPHRQAFCAELAALSQQLASGGRRLD